MKLDKIKFAKVVQFIGRCFDDAELRELDDLIDINVEPVTTQYVPVDAVNELLKCMMTADKEGFIPAIKAYRSLTGAGLNESKEAIERYRKQPIDRSATLGDILDQAKRHV